MEHLNLRDIKTSTIGSFPLADSLANRRRCLEALIKIEIDYPAYPQLIDMGKQFLDDLVDQDNGVTFIDGKYKLKGKEIETDLPSIGLEPFMWTIRHLKNTNRKSCITLRAPITGPFTLASYIETGPGVFPFNTAASNPLLIQQLTNELSKSCRVASKMASMISIDEPILGVIVGSKKAFGCAEDDIIETYNHLKKSCGNRIVGTHICGRISSRLANLLVLTDLDFLSHEFYDEPKNAKVYSPKKLEDNGKVLSVGCISTKDPTVESPKQILKFMNQYKMYGFPLMFTPDCGFSNLPTRKAEPEGAYWTSVKKLKNMVKAARRYKQQNNQTNTLPTTCC